MSIPLLQLSEHNTTICSRMTWPRELYFDFIYRLLEMENQSITYEQGIQFNQTWETAQSFFVWYIFYQLIMAILDLLPQDADKWKDKKIIISRQHLTQEYKYILKSHQFDAEKYILFTDHCLPFF